MKTLWQDARYGLRMLLKKPGFTLTAVITLSLGIGATSTIFSFVNGVLLRPLPYRDSERLVLLDEIAGKRGNAPMGVSPLNFLDWREQNRVFTGVAAFDDGGYSLTGSGEPERLSGASISYNTFEILGVAPILGRTFTAEEDRPGSDLVVILGHGLWERRFGANPEVIGQKITLNNRSRTVIGVMPPDFKFPEVAELWAPLAIDTGHWARTDHGWDAIARLKPGVTLDQAQSDITAVARHIEEQNPVTNKGMGVILIPLREGLVSSDYRRALWILMGVVGLVLLIACVNVANLLLSRASVRSKEVAIRTALGAGRWRVFRQLLTESMLLGFMGGALGWGLALWGLDLLLAAIPIDFPFWMKFNLDGRVLGFTAGVTLLTGLIFGAAPALQASKVDLNEALKEGARSASGAGRHRTLRSLVVAEMALSLILLIGAGLMMSSFMRLQHTNPGLNPNNLLTARVELPEAKYNTPEKLQAFFKDLLERVSALPGVQAAGAVSRLPLAGGGWGRRMTVEDFPVLQSGQTPVINHCVITPNYFHAAGIPILTGRDFTDADARDSMKVTIIDDRLAREYWPNQSPIGKRVRFGPPENNEPWHTIVGVVGAVKNESLNLTQRKTVYLPYAQIAINGMALAVRVANPENLGPAIRGQVKAVDHDQPVIDVRPMTEVISRSVWQPRLYAILFGVFAAVAVALASVGVYGVMAYSVSERTREIGIRVALGAQRHDVLKLVVAQGLTLALIGAGIGLAGALALTRLMQSLLFEVSATDPLTFAGLAALLTFVAMLACYLPARRATKVDPIVALRCE
ncbi:MAG TPA: ABC transporter permease [Blastocatellia bacterium]|jgi:putative ABC transport system permease protein|nr:ABC transporter permease [Blastocatellia bacterium]